MKTLAQRLTIDPGEGEETWLGGVGVVFKVYGQDTGGALAVVEHPVLPGALVPPHVHHGEDELSIVVEGNVGVRIGQRVIEAGPGSYVFKPRGIPHTFWNAGTSQARLIELIWPAGLEHFFVELGAAFEAASGEPDPELIRELSEQYGTEYVMDWVPELESNYGVSVLHNGGHARPR